MLSGRGFQHTVDIPIVTICPSLRLVSLFVRGRIQTGASAEKREKPDPLISRSAI